MTDLTNSTQVNIPVDWDNLELYRQPDAVHRPDLLDAQARRQMLETLGNVKDGISAAEQKQTLDAYRSLRPDQASMDLRVQQNAEIERRLNEAFRTNPQLIDLAQNYDRMGDADIARNLQAVLDLQNNVLQGGGARRVSTFRDSSRGAPAGEANGATASINLLDHDGNRPSLRSLIGTLLHENRHVHQHWLADNADRIPSNDPRKSDAEIFKITHEIRRNNHSPGNGDFTYSDNPVEIDARSFEAPADSPHLKTILQEHKAEGQRIIEENTRKILSADLSSPQIPADWDKIAAAIPNMVPEPEDIWAKAARKSSEEIARNSEVTRSTSSFIDRLEVSDRRWAHKGAWELTDPETGKQYYVKRAPQEELDLTRRLQQVQLPADSNLVLPKVAGEGERLPASVLEEVRAWQVDPRFPRDALLLTEKHNVILSDNGVPATTFTVRNDPAALRGVPINQQDVNLLMRDVESLNRNGLYNSDFGSNLFLSRGDDGKLRFHAIDFEPSTFDRTAGLGKFEDVDHLEKQLGHLQQAGIVEPNVRLNPNLDAERLATLNWQSAITENMTPVTRVSVANWPEEHVNGMQEALRAQGIESTRMTSSTLGETVRIADQDFTKFQGFLREQDMRTLSAGGWVPANGQADVAVGNSTPQQLARFEQALSRTGVEAQRGLDEKGARVLRVSGDSNLARLEQLTTPERPIIRAQDATPVMVPQQSQQQQFQHQPSQAQRDLQEQQRQEQRARSEAVARPEAPVPAPAAVPEVRVTAAPADPGARERPSLREAFGQALAARETGAGFHQTGRGVGIAMGAYGLYEQVQSSKEDLANGQTRNLAAAGIAANTVAVVADTAEVATAARVARNAKLVERVAETSDDLARLAKAGKTLAGLSRASKALPVVSTVLTVGAGAIEGTIGYKNGDGARTARAAGSTAGGLAGAAAGGYVGAQGGAIVGGTIGAFFGGVGAVPGAAIGGFIGGVGGAIYGGFKGADLGGQAAEKVAGKALQAKFDERLQGALNGLNQNRTWVNKLDKDHDGKIDMKELRSSLDKYGIKNHAQIDANHDGKVTGIEISQTLNRGIQQEGARAAAATEASRQNRLKPALDGLNANASWVKHMDRDGDGKISQAELNRSLKQHGLTKFSQVDSDHNGQVSAREMSQGLNRAIAEERREIAIDRKGMDRMSADQLRHSIHDDPTLSHLKMGGKNIDAIMKDPGALKSAADRFEAMHVRGDGDYSKQVAVLRELSERQSGHSVVTQIPAPLPALGR